MCRLRAIYKSGSTSVASEATASPESRNQRSFASALSVGRNLHCSYFVGTSNSLLFTIHLDNKNNVQLETYIIDIGDQALKEGVTRFASDCASPGKFNADVARELYITLLAPAHDVISRSALSILVPDGPLYDVPFQVLIDNRCNTIVTISRECRLIYAALSKVFRLCNLDETVYRWA